MKYGARMIMPIDDDGNFMEGGGPFAGMNVDDANPVIIKWLEERGMLLARVDITHSYPHCWRCHQPVIFRATDQWFVSMDETGLRADALAAIDRVQWVPSWSKNRINAMISDRPDWCISRQRSWGVPIPVFKCKSCGETVATPETFDAVIALFRNEGSDAWFIRDPSEYLPEGTCCEHCGGTEFVPEKDILDVWWESGVSHTAVCDSDEFPLLHRPAEMYLEGSDQHRGWFQSSLLTSVGTYGIAPYRAVMSCGFTVDEFGRKMSKSLGNGVDPADVIAEYGADVLRLWVSSSDYGQDVSISKNILDRSADAYRKIRNNFRFLLGNLDDFDDATDAVSFDEMPEIDRCEMARLVKLRDTVTQAYLEYHFHTVFRSIYDYTVELSSVYMDMLKDRLYSDAKKSAARRSAQTVLANILEFLVRAWTPILSFTCDEVWEHYPLTMKANYTDRPESVQLAGWCEREDFNPQVPQDRLDALVEEFDTILSARETVTKALEAARDASTIGKSQEAAVRLVAPASQIKVLEGLGQEALAEMFIVAHVDLESREGESEAIVSVAQGEKCPRCWNIRELGSDGLCARCHDVVSSFEDQA